MGADDELQPVRAQEVLRDVGTEGDADAALALGAAGHDLRVGPEHLGHEAVVGDVAEAVHLLDVGDRDAVLAEEAAVRDEHLAVDHVRERQAVEDVLEEQEDVVVVLVPHLAVEAVHAVEPDRLVVPAGEEDVLGVRDLVREQRDDVLNGVRAAVDEVAVEQVAVRRARDAVELEDVQRVVELPVRVAAHGDFLALRHVDARHVGLRLEHVDRLQQDRDDVALADELLVAEVGRHGGDEVGRDLVVGADARAVVRRRDRDVALGELHVHGLRVRRRDRLGELDLAVHLLALLQLLLRVGVVGHHLRDGAVLGEGLLHLAELQEGGRLAVARLGEAGVDLEGAVGVGDGLTGEAELDVGEGAVAEERGARLGVDGDGVRGDGLLEAARLEVLVAGEPVLLRVRH
mmetsp:Transcript_36667/g.112992  ORF Transcript_36667/g.112992 Transcript_36667/m.112992 type:complete len:403 (-) Transcript_36667:31-1239(-)